MPVFAIKNKVACLLVLVSFTPIAMADIRSATGKPLLDFYTVYGAIDSVRIINELCSRYYPEYKEENDRAYSSWRSKNKDFIYKVEQYNHAIVTKKSKANEASYRKEILKAAQIYEENKVAMHKMFSDYGEAVYRSTCAVYPDYTISEKADYPVYYKEHMQVFENYWHK